MEKMKIVIVDDQRLFRENLKTVIELSLPTASVVGLAGNGEEGLEVISRCDPDIVIMDINMPVMNGIECLKHLRETGNQVKVLLLTIFEDDQYLIESMQLGVSAYMLKDTEPDQLVRILRSIQSDCIMLPQNLAEKLAYQVSSGKALKETRQVKGFSKLTQREFEILRHIGYGEDNQEISAKMHLSEGTVRNYVSSIYEKLELKDRSQAIRLAIYSEIL